MIPSEMRLYYPMKYNFFVIDGLVLYNSRIVISNKLRSEILNKIHNGHFGINKCCARAEQAVRWLGLSTELKKLVEFLSKCVEQRTNHEEQFFQEQFPSRAWEKVALDLFKCEK